MKLSFWKLSGAGNDFVLLDRTPKKFSLPSLARRLCDRRRGIGADGMLLVAAGKTPRVRYWNADGSKAFCGNGTRSAGLWLHARGLVGARNFALETAVGKLSIHILSATRAAVRMPPPSTAHLPRVLAAAGRKIEVLQIDTGAPHAVAFVEKLDRFPVFEIGRALRRHHAFAPAGANIDFVERKGSRWNLRTYERGVEDETLACGTGVVAAALAAALTRGARSPVPVRVRGGDALSVRFKRFGAGFSDLWLEGPAVTVYQGEINI